MNIKQVTDTGDTVWFDIDGVNWGIDEQLQVCDFDGYPQSQGFYDQNDDLYQLLVTGYNAYMEHK